MRKAGRSVLIQGLIALSLSISSVEAENNWDGIWPVDGAGVTAPPGGKIVTGPRYLYSRDSRTYYITDKTNKRVKTVSMDKNGNLFRVASYTDKGEFTTFIERDPRFVDREARFKKGEVTRMEERLFKGKPHFRRKHFRDGTATEAYFKDGALISRVWVKDGDVLDYDLTEAAIKDLRSGSEVNSFLDQGKCFFIDCRSVETMRQSSDKKPMRRRKARKSVKKLPDGYCCEDAGKELGLLFQGVFYRPFGFGNNYQEAIKDGLARASGIIKSRIQSESLDYNSQSRDKQGNARAFFENIQKRIDTSQTVIYDYEVLQKIKGEAEAKIGNIMEGEYAVELSVRPGYVYDCREALKMKPVENYTDLSGCWEDEKGHSIIIRQQGINLFATHSFHNRTFTGVLEKDAVTLRYVFKDVNDYNNVPWYYADKPPLAVLRQALRLYQMVDVRLEQGEKLYFEDEAKQEKAEVMVL